MILPGYRLWVISFYVFLIYQNPVLLLIDSKGRGFPVILMLIGAIRASSFRSGGKSEISFFYHKGYEGFS